MILKKLKKSICIVTAGFLAVTSMPVMANEWKPVSEENTIASSETEKYYHLGMGYHVTWQRSNGQWTDGAPGSTQSATINLSKNEVESLANNVPGLVGKKIKNVSVQLYSLEQHQTKQNPLPKWDDKKFGYWPTVQNGGRDTNGSVTWKGDHKLFFQNYSEYFAQNIRLDNNSISYNEKTGALTYKYSYMLSTAQSLSSDKLGFPIHYNFRDYRKNYDFNTSVSKTTSDVESYLGSNNMDVTFDVLENNPKTSATFYILPLLYVFEAEADEPGVVITAPPQDKMIICDPKSNSGPIQLLVNRARASWQKTTGKVIFTDATGKNKDFRIEKEIPGSAYQNNFLQMTWCIPYDVDRLLVTFIPDPSKPDETYVSEYERNQNDLGIGKITLEKNNTSVNAPTPNVDHVTKIELVNLGEKVVENPTIDITVTEIGKTEPFYKDTVTVDKDLNGNGTVTIPSNTFKPTTNKIEVCGIVNQSHTDKNDNIQNENDKKCQKFEGVQDMSLGQKVTLKHNGKEVSELTPGKDMQISYVVKNIAGPLAVGTDESTNPKATLEITVKDKDTGKVIYSGKNHKTNEVLQPGGMVDIATNDIKIPSTTTSIEACAVISYKHDEVGFNIRNNEHDTRCQTFSTTKNYAIRDLTVSPKVVDMSGSSVTQPLMFKFTLANESSGLGVDSPLVTIKQGAKVLWSKNIPVAKGQVTVELANVMATMSANTTFTVEVNPNRTEVEKKKDGSDPYADNKKSTSVSVNKLPQCAGCTKSNTSNSWKEKFSLSQTYQYWDYWYHWNDDKKCEHEDLENGTATDSKEKDYTESYTIKKIYLRSKWSIDTKAGDSQGWVDMTNGGNFKIKAGTPLEIKVVTNYTTNRNVLPTVPSRLSTVPSNGFNLGTVQITDGVAPVNVPQKTFVQIDKNLKLEDSSSLKNCFELQGNITGEWYNATATRTFAPRKNLQGTGNVSAVYIAKDAKIGKYKLDVYTNVSKGYQPNNVVSGVIKDLQACKSITIEVIANNDITTGIIQ